MPNRRAHAIVGVGAGITAAAYQAREKPTDDLVLELLGGGFGGWLGGIAPDVFEPATSPNHRDVAHSVAAGAIIAFSRITTWQDRCRKVAQNKQALAAAPGASSVVQADAYWASLFWRLAAGALVGFAAGYLSHLALDSRTTKSIPLLTS